MLDIGWSEFLVIGVVALVVVGPKELPVMFRTLGRFTAKARNMSREFTRAMEAAAKETGIGDVAKDLKSVTSPRSLGMDAMENAAARFEKWDPLKKATPAKPVVAKEPAPPAEPVAAAADIGPNTAALAVERAEKRAAVIKAAETRAAERAEAAAPPAAKVSKARAKSDKPLDKAVAKAKAATKTPAAKAEVALEAKPKARSRTKAAAVAPAAEPAAKPVRRPRKSAAGTGEA